MSTTLCEMEFQSGADFQKSKRCFWLCGTFVSCERSGSHVACAILYIAIQMCHDPEEECVSKGQIDIFTFISACYVDLEGFWYAGNQSLIVHQDSIRSFVFNTKTELQRLLAGEGIC